MDIFIYSSLYVSKQGLIYLVIQVLHISNQVYSEQSLLIL